MTLLEYLIALAILVAETFAADGTRQVEGLSTADDRVDVTVSGLARDGQAVLPTPTMAAPTLEARATATAVPSSPSWPTHRALRASEMRSLARAAGFPEWAIPAALSVAWCESRWKPWATGAAGERGLMQVHPIHFDSTYDPLGNMRAALRIWRERGSTWAAWTCQP